MMTPAHSCVIPAKAGNQSRRRLALITAGLAVCIMLALLTALPVYAYVTPGMGLTPAGDNSGIQCSDSFKQLVSCATRILNRVIPIIFVLALIAILWGLAQTLRNPEGEAELKKARNIIIWGILALTIMVCTWGIVAWVRSLIDLDLSEPQMPNSALPSPPSATF